MWKNQKGFSLVEVVIVIALVAILAGSSIAMVGHIRYANTKKVAEEVDSALSRLRLDTMSREEHQYLYIYRYSDGIEDGYSDGYYVRLLDENVTPKVGHDEKLNGNGTRLCGTNVTFYMDDGTPVDKDNYIRIAYKKNGVFRVEDDPAGTMGTNTESITIRGTGTYTIRLNYDTGRHYIE